MNGIGGKIKKNESSLSAMNRESREEADLHGVGWICGGRMCGVNNDGSGFFCYIFYAFTDKITGYCQNENEEIMIYPSSPVRSDTIDNLHYLIPYGIYAMQAPQAYSNGHPRFTIIYD